MGHVNNNDSNVRQYVERRLRRNILPARALKKKQVALISTYGATKTNGAHIVRSVIRGKSY